MLNVDKHEFIKNQDKATYKQGRLGLMFTMNYFLSINSSASNDGRIVTFTLPESEQVNDCF